MTDREKLIAIIEKSLDDGFKKHIPLTSNFLADCLLENSIMVPPCKVGDKVYEVVRNKDPKLAHILTMNCVGFHSSERDNVRGTYQLTYIIVRSKYGKGVHHTDCRKIGKTVFFDLAEAEAALQKIRGE